MDHKVTFDELANQAKELRHRLIRISEMAEEKLLLLKGDATPVGDLWEAANELRHIKSMADGKTPHAW
jgi:hypothetical protein